MAFSRPGAHDDDAETLPVVGADVRRAPGGSHRVDRTPLVDPNVLHELEDQLDSPAAARAFVRDYVAVWDERDSRISSAIARRNQAASLDAVLSLKITSTMVGATQLVTLATALEGLLREGKLEEAEAALPSVHRCGIRTMRELRLLHLN
ncbi:Hpt domain-containing protein [uncultured Arthrobacter sp.]|uniref:Hpt domain-containing protein n=1 Tax=uncultured Arthrobacter sp. TaxID=114050 RepID=UPI002633ADD8|nr:Hpt domain-containing protein [uncultured Arthrobacter sp.]